ncbi:hypothetical protein [uncultured Treponema sp.]|uniref:hypothetical protein n=1 Tax=uncultured Treponema sp. TaxID=162155 RepID=UPI00280AACA4|nr:hypothetical protein [uncultured Treponema sp.]
MYTATKIESEILKILNQNEPLEKQKIMEEICKIKAKDSAVTPKTIQNALEGCIAKGFAASADGGKFKITEEGKKQI